MAEATNLKVDFERYIDIGVASPGSALSPAQGLAAMIEAVHLTIVGGNPLAIAFPGLVAGEVASLGATIRVMGSAHSIDAFLKNNVVAGLGMARAIAVGKPLAIPSVSDGMAYVRSRIEKYFPGGIDRLDRRTRMRRKIGKSLMDEHDISNRRASLAARAKSIAKLPSVSIRSLSTGNEVPLFILPISRPVDQQGFSNYGLAHAESGSVPFF